MANISMKVIYFRFQLCGRQCYVKHVHEGNLLSFSTVWPLVLCQIFPLRLSTFIFNCDVKHLHEDNVLSFSTVYRL